MRLFNNIKDIEGLPEDAGIALTIGCFDAVHKGHKYLIQSLIEKSKEKNLESALMLFRQHPLSLLRPQNAPPMIHTIEQRTGFVKSLGVENLIIQDFDKDFSQLSADEFVKLLSTKLKVKYLLLGFDFHFGKKRSGNYKYLTENPPPFEFDELGRFKIEGERISSSKIRDRISAGEIETVRNMMGRPYELTGLVEDGEKRGKKLGFATANLKPDQEISPAKGVYICETLIEGQNYPSIANYGLKPTFGNEHEAVLEVHIFNFNGNLYGQSLKVSLLSFIRPEIKFKDAEALKEQVQKDISSAKNYFQLQ